jgi:2-polyprenyl-3-methyl-5-hydroxy-6-metoxy-1,4-benzoquinol methylase
MRAPDRFHGRSDVYVLARCQNCSLVWTDDPPRPQEMGIHYSADYDRLIALAGEGSPAHAIGRREEVLKHKKQGRLLDLGCSSGAFLTAMKSPSWELSGIEMSKAIAKKAEERSGATVFAGDVMDAPLKTILLM